MARMLVKDAEVANRETRAFLALFRAHEEEFRAYYEASEVTKRRRRRRGAT